MLKKQRRRLWTFKKKSTYHFSCFLFRKLLVRGYDQLRFFLNLLLFYLLWHVLWEFPKVLAKWNTYWLADSSSLSRDSPRRLKWILTGILFKWLMNRGVLAHMRQISCGWDSSALLYTTEKFHIEAAHSTLSQRRPIVGISSEWYQSYFKCHLNAYLPLSDPWYRRRNRKGDPTLSRYPKDQKNSESTTSTTINFYIPEQQRWWEQSLQTLWRSSGDVPQWCGRQCWQQSAWQHNAAACLLKKEPEQSHLLLASRSETQQARLGSKQCEHLHSNKI